VAEVICIALTAEELAFVDQNSVLMGHTDVRHWIRALALEGYTVPAVNAAVAQWLL